MNVSNSTEILGCCLGEIVDSLELSDSLSSVWTGLESSGNCSENLSSAIFECGAYKCLIENTTLYGGVLGLTGSFCAYYVCYEFFSTDYAF